MKPRTQLITAVIFTFFTLLAILPLLFVHESTALRYIGNRSFFVYSAVRCMLRDMKAY